MRRDSGSLVEGASGASGFIGWIRGCTLLLSVVLLAGCAGREAEPPKLATNPLENMNELLLSLAQRLETLATGDRELALALRSQAESLDSLGRSQPALEAIDKALAQAPDAELQQELLSTKAAILFSLDRASDALAILVPMLALEQSPSAEQMAAGQGDLSQEYIVAAFCYMRLERWSDAARALSRTQPAGPEDDLAAYVALTYSYIKARSGESVSDAWLDAQVEFSAANDAGHYGALIQMWRGDFNRDQIAKGLSALKGTEQQDALGEVLFHRMAYARYVENDPDMAAELYGRLNDLAPYGNIEWIYARQLIGIVR